MAKYYTNRKHAYKVIRIYKRGGRVKLANRYGAEFKIAISKLEENGYKEVSYKPNIF